MVIYLDILIITNIYIMWFVIKGTSRITHLKISLKRLTLVSFLGGIFALQILILPQNSTLKLIVILLKLVSFYILACIAFPIKDKKRQAKAALAAFSVNMLFSAFVSFFQSLTNTRIIYVQNMTAYFDISIFILIGATIISYVIICIFSLVLRRSLNTTHSFTVEIDTENGRYVFEGIADTGNNVFDLFSGRPVIICTSKSLYNDISKENSYPKGYRLLPFSTISSNGVIPAFIPEKLTISDENGEIHMPDALVGVISDDKSASRAVFNPTIIL